LSFLDLENLLGLLVEAESVSEGSGKLGSKELSSSGWVLMELSSQSSSLLLVENGKVSGDVLSDSSNFSQFGCATRWGLSISQIS
jgi:hypothetical protein